MFNKILIQTKQCFNQNWLMRHNKLTQDKYELTFGTNLTTNLFTNNDTFHTECKCKHFI